MDPLGVLQLPPNPLLKTVSSKKTLDVSLNKVKIISIFIFKRISCMQWLFWIFTNIKKMSGTSFWCLFSAWFFHENVPYLILCLWIKFQCHTFFSSQDMKQNVLSSYLDNWWRHKLWFIFDHLLKQWPTGKNKREGRKYKNLNILRK